MPLTSRDRGFLRAVDRLKLYVMAMALTIFVYLLYVPTDEIRMVTSVIGLALCGVFWLTQRLLSFISVLDLELTRVLNVLKSTLPEEQRRELPR